MVENESKRNGVELVKVLHLADLHLGKRLNEFNLLEDQRYILSQIVTIAREEEVDGVLICGDVYDKSQPSAEAFELLDRFLTELVAQNLQVLMISGNHDSPERLSFGSRIMHRAGLYAAGRFRGCPERVTLEDEHGPVHFYLLPFIRPAHVRPYFEQKIESYHQAVAAVLEAEPIKKTERNVLLAHQFVLSGEVEPERSDSETVAVGGLDSVDASILQDFDYVALGHLHRAQSIGGEQIRYAGSPLKYSFSEARHIKSVAVITLAAKGEVEIRQRPLTPLRDLREIRGPLAELLRLGQEAREGQDDYFRIILTDQEELYDPLGQLRPVYPNLMSLEFEHRKTQPAEYEIAPSGDLTDQGPIDLFAGFYELQNNEQLTEEQITVLEEVFAEAGGDEP